MHDGAFDCTVEHGQHLSKGSAPATWPGACNGIDGVAWIMNFPFGIDSSFD